MSDDLFGKKKDVVPVLDLSKSIVTNKDELKRLMEKVPDYKMRPVKVRSEDIKIKDKDWSFKCPRKEVKALLKSNGERERPYTYLDPIPSEMMGGIKISDLCLVPIDWKMLTTLRPKNKIDEDFFSKLVEVHVKYLCPLWSYANLLITSFQLGKLQIKTEQRDKRDNLFSSSLFGTTNLTQNQASLLATAVRKVKNRSGLIEKRPITCLECSEEFCLSRGCSDFNYDLFVRVPVSQAAQQILVKSSTGGGLSKSRRKKKGVSPDRSVKKKSGKGKFKRQDTSGNSKDKKKETKPKKKVGPSKKK